MVTTDGQTNRLLYPCTCARGNYAPAIDIGAVQSIEIHWSWTKGMKRLWSFYVGLKTRKEIRPSHRTDVLSHAIAHYSWKKGEIRHHDMAWTKVHNLDTSNSGILSAIIATPILTLSFYQETLILCMCLQRAYRSLLQLELLIS